MASLKDKLNSLRSEMLMLSRSNEEVQIIVGQQKRVPVTRIIEVGEDYVEFGTKMPIQAVERRDIIPMHMIMIMWEISL